MLVSPGPIDGYPPVQYQARILANAGHPVTVVTTPLRLGEARASFAQPGVKVRCVAIDGSRTQRMMRFAKALWSERWRLPRDMTEIAYDPIGILYSDLVPRHPRRRVAHLHELLQNIDQFVEARLKRSIHRFDAVVVPDAKRAQLTQQMLGMEALPLVVENYPLRAATPLAARKGHKSRFEVIYCGSLGLQQRLDVVIQSMAAWPKHADLVLIGNDITPTAQKLKRLAADMGLSGRVHFLGWMDTAAAEERLALADLGIALLDPQFQQWRTALGASNKRYQIMKAGLPQIGDTNPGVPELLDGIGACVDAENHDPAEIAALVTDYASNSARCAHEGANAFALHQTTYNYERVFRQLHEKIVS